MKTLKLAAFALALGFFAASCGGNTETPETVVDSTSTTVETAPAETAPAEPATTAPVDSTTTTTTTTDTVKK